jgi:pyruvate formate lyase activating enzyme
MTTCTVFDIKSFSIHDGPGTRTTVFLKGCPLHCAWCHNPESISPQIEFQYWQERCIGCGTCAECCPTGAMTIENGKPARDAEVCEECYTCIENCPGEAWQRIGQAMTVDEVMKAVRKDILCYDESGGGVTFSGGEPLMQPDALSDLLLACHDLGIHTTLDTCGMAPRNVLEKVVDEVDLFLFDLKLMDSELHRRYMGVPNEVILDNLRWLDAQGKTIVVRIPVIPGINDNRENLAAVMEFLNCLEHHHEVHLLAYHQTAVDKYRRMEQEYSLPHVQPPTPDDMEKIRHLFEKNGFNVSIGG